MKQAGIAIYVVITTILLFGLFETLYGWSQLLELSASMHSHYPSTGSFYNPGPFCAYIAILSPLALYYVLISQFRPIQWLSCLYIISAFSLMPALMGRTGWIAAATGCLYVLFACKKIQKLRTRTFCIVLLVVVVIGILLFYLKPQSALGRLLLWQDGIYAILGHPSGVGWDSVAGALGNAQENYFASHANSSLSQVAGSPEYAFNEFLQIGIAYGILGLAMFVFVLYVSIKYANKAKQYGITGSLVAFIVVCLSSYPLQFPEFIITTTLMVMALSCAETTKFHFHLISVTVGALALLSCMSIQNRKSKSDDWNRMKYMYQYQLSDRDCQYLDSLMSGLSWDNHFLFDYGKALRNNGYFEKSTEILQQGARQSSDPMFLNLIGRNYQDIKDYRQAEHFYIRSTNRLPGRVYPYYLLTKLYCDSANFNYSKFTSTYDKAMSLQSKINSVAVNQMRSELQILKDSVERIKNKSPDSLKTQAFR